jgi:hypothetical protein
MLLPTEMWSLLYVCSRMENVEHFKLDLPPYVCLSTSFFIIIQLRRPGVVVDVGCIFTSNLCNGLYCHSQIKCQYEVTGGAAVANLSIRLVTSLEAMTLLTQRSSTRKCFFFPLHHVRKANVCRLMGRRETLEGILLWLIRPVAPAYGKGRPAF